MKAKKQEMSLRGNAIIATRILNFWWCLCLLLLGCRSLVQAEEHNNTPALMGESQYQFLVKESSVVTRILEDDEKKGTSTDETPDEASKDDKKEKTTSSSTAAPTKKKKKKSTDLCSSAKTCEDCLQLLTEFKANHTISEDQVCVWHDGKCTTGTSAEFPHADQMCATSKDPQEPPATDAPDDEKATTNAPTTKASTTDKDKKSTTNAPAKADGKEETAPSPTKAPTEAVPETTTKPSVAPTPKPTKSSSEAATPTTKAPTPKPTKAPTPKPTKALTPEPSSSPSPAPKATPAPTKQGGEHDVWTFSKLLFGVVLLIFMCYCYNRRKFTGHRHHHHGDLSGPRYEGVSTREKDEEDDWDWDDDGGGGDVELGGGGVGMSSKNNTNTTTTAMRPSSYQQPLYRDQQMPRTGRHDSLKRRSNSGDGSNEPPSPPKALSPKKQPPLKMPPPKTDDIFAEMGFSAKPTFGSGKAAATTVKKSPPVHGLGAVPLPLDSDDAGDNWGDDADLDDLLND